MLIITPAGNLQIVTSAAGQVSVQSSWVDSDGTNVNAGVSNPVTFTGAAANVAVSGPTSPNLRNVQEVSIRNISATVAQNITVQHTDGVTLLEKFKCSLAIGESCQYDEQGRWSVYDANGVVKTASSAPGALVQRRVFTSGTSVVLSALTRSVKVQVRAGGGGGGGCVSAAAAAACGGGGSSGGYVERYFTGVTPGATLTYAIGGGGQGGANNGSTGVTGGNSSITINSINVAANGGIGGTGVLTATTAAAIALGGNVPSSSSNGDLNDSGTAGEAGIQFSGTVGYGGRGGGQGGANARNTGGVGNNGVTSTGGGGGGACVLNGSVASAGGNGAAGYIVLEEYS